MSSLKALVAFMAVAAVAELAAGKTYKIKWTDEGNYGDWSSTNKVTVGDSVVFTYGSPHTVDELTEADYKACSFDKPASTDSSGNTSFTFDAAGTRYFACAADSHCRQGQKVAVTVAGGGSPAPSGGQSPGTPRATPKANSVTPPATTKANSATANSAELVVKLVLGLATGGAMLTAF